MTIFIKVRQMVMKMIMISIMKIFLMIILIISLNIIILKLRQSAVKKTLALLAVLQLAVYSIRAITFMTRMKANVSATA